MNGARSDSNSLLPRRSSAFIFSLLFLLYLFDYLDRYVVVSLFPYLQRDWGLSDTQCGMLTSAVYWSIVVFSFPASIVIDRWSRRKSIGITAAAFSPAAVAVTQDVVHPGLRATSYSLCVIVQNLLGSSLGPLLVGALSGRHGIEAALKIVPIFLFLSGVLFFIGSFFYERDLAKVAEVPVRPEP